MLYESQLRGKQPARVISCLVMISGSTTGRVQTHSEKPGRPARNNSLMSNAENSFLLKLWIT